MKSQIKKWFSVELAEQKVTKMKEFLRDNKILFESSGCFNLVHFECCANECEAESISRYLKTIDSNGE